MVDHRVADDLDDLGVPLVAIHGADDRSAPLAAVRSLLATRPQARLVVFAGDHHLDARRLEVVARQLASLVQVPAGDGLAVTMAAW